ncbi:uncharacterized protein EV422DRAFT_508625 [Fimicolochytrium jonesii]|uniref:uncharacterized protein n=1 Tax=Fimicolochytrium jonesii TaxID=1396493 RepID=UPI0022FED32C|nr:uncharacterized protein EV422DRAFT_508625 [Fimicolochytrium jonesii]KAI8817789.1 hypothetical protein EV422DRAFT_508625 [Fimicolochytrium jonesii]
MVVDFLRGRTESTRGAGKVRPFWPFWPGAQALDERHEWDGTQEPGQLVEMVGMWKALDSWVAWKATLVSRQSAQGKRKIDHLYGNETAASESNGPAQDRVDSGETGLTEGQIAPSAGELGDVEELLGLHQALNGDYNYLHANDVRQSRGDECLQIVEKGGSVPAVRGSKCEPGGVDPQHASQDNYNESRDLVTGHIPDSYEQFVEPEEWLGLYEAVSNGTPYRRLFKAPQPKD